MKNKKALNESLENINKPLESINKPLEEINTELQKTDDELKKIEESVFIQQSPVLEETPVFETIKKEEKETVHYYKIICIDNKKRRELYTKISPSFNNHILEIQAPFEKLSLKENILNKATILLDCKVELDVEKLNISIESGVFVSICEEQKWMQILSTDAIKVFNKRVLEAYREQTASLPKKETPKEIKSKEANNFGLTNF